MAPAPALNEIKDLKISSLELDVRSTIQDHLISDIQPANLKKRNSLPGSSPNPIFHTLAARDGGPSITPSYGGAVDPTNINMKGLQALFALIGASFVVAIIWFFFWAKNGGFQWRKGDWDDYKSTVLRRKGPNGTTLSNATKSTRLGGGSVVGEGFSDSSASTADGTFTETMTEVSSEAPIMNGGHGRRETAKDRKIREVKEANFEGGHDEDVLAYIREKPARVGGINRDSDALHYGTDYTDTDGSQVHSVSNGNYQRPGRVSGPRGASNSRQASPEKRQPQHQPSRRDFSFTHDDTFSVASSEAAAPPLQYPPIHIPMPQPAAQPQYQYQYQHQHQHQHADAPPPAPPHRPGRYHSPSKQFQNDTARRSPVHSDVQSQNTKSYHHPLPSLANQSPGRGYRRDRRDSLDD